MKLRHPSCYVVLSCVAVVSCSQEPLDLGDSLDSLVNASSGGAPSSADSNGGSLASTPGGASEMGGSYNRITGPSGACTPERATLGECYNWRGYAENYQFRSGSDYVRISKYQATETWEIQFGDVTLPPLDANRGNPQPFGSDLELLEGFAYPLSDVTHTSLRLQFNFDPHQYWTDWCAAQAPMPVGSGYACVPLGPYVSDLTETTCWLASDPATTWDCTKNELCMVDTGVCACNATACSVRPSKCLVHADLRETGPDLDGSLVLKCPSNVAPPPATGLPLTIHLMGWIN